MGRVLLRVLWGNIVGMYFGELRIDPGTEDKLHRKHRGITSKDVVEAIQWPARCEAIWEEHPDHGERAVAIGAVADGRELICALTPLPERDGQQADTWIIRTARWL